MLACLRLSRHIHEASAIISPIKSPIATSPRMLWADRPTPQLVRNIEALFLEGLSACVMARSACVGTCIALAA